MDTSDISATLQNPFRHLLLIVNPISGTAGPQERCAQAQRILQTLRQAGHEVTLEITHAHGDATRLSRRAVAEGYDAVLACGGDGTINEAARALCDTGVPLAILPAGSGNGLARHIGLPIHPELALKVMLEGNVVDCDYATADGHQFFCTFGMGFDAAVSHRFARQKHRGPLMYVKSALTEWIHYRPSTYLLTLPDGQCLAEDAFLVAICNASQYGNNAYIAPGASITDGLLDVVIVRPSTVFSQALMGVEMMTGTLDRNTSVHALRLPSVGIERVDGEESPAPVEAHIDGEPTAFNPGRIDFQTHKGGLRLFVPKAEKPFRPVITPVTSMVSDWKIALGFKR